MFRLPWRLQTAFRPRFYHRAVGPSSKDSRTQGGLHEQPTTTRPVLPELRHAAGQAGYFGTDVTGYRINDYCHYCFADGAFTSPRASAKEMIDKAVDAMVRKGIMPAAQARALMTVVIPKLKRWQSAPSRQEVGSAAS